VTDGALIVLRDHLGHGEGRGGLARLGTETLREVSEKARRIAPRIQGVLPHLNNEIARAHAEKLEVGSNRMQQFCGDRLPGFGKVDGLQFVLRRSVSGAGVFISIITLLRRSSSGADARPRILGFLLFARAFRSFLFCSFLFLMMMFPSFPFYGTFLR
jgi:hypothetical protein